MNLCGDRDTRRLDRIEEIKRTSPGKVGFYEVRWKYDGCSYDWPVHPYVVRGADDEVRGWWIFLVPIPLWPTMTLRLRRLFSRAWTREGVRDLVTLDGYSDVALANWENVSAQTVGEFREWMALHDLRTWKDEVDDFFDRMACL